MMYLALSYDHASSTAERDLPRSASRRAWRTRSGWCSTCDPSTRAPAGFGSPKPSSGTRHGDDPEFAPIEVYLTVRGRRGIEFYQQPSAHENSRLADDSNASSQSNGGQIMISDESPSTAAHPLPALSGGASVTVNINLPRRAEVTRFWRCRKAGARITMPAGDMFWAPLRPPRRPSHAWSFSAPLEKT